MGYSTVELERPCDLCVVKVAKMQLHLREAHVGYVCWECAEDFMTKVATESDYAREHPIEARQGLAKFKAYVADLRRKELH